MITSAKNSGWTSDYLISSLEGTGLSAPSIIRQKIFTIDFRLIIKCTGELSTSDTQEVIKQFKLHLASLCSGDSSR
jgi:mRNA interferase MazF